MALAGMEWIVIIVVAAVILIWGPRKIPDLAKGIGQAKGEFEKASREYVSAASEAASPDQKTASSVSSQKNEDSSDDILVETARKLGVNTLGKTRAEISKEILDKYGLEKKYPVA